MDQNWEVTCLASKAPDKNGGKAEQNNELWDKNEQDGPVITNKQSMPNECLLFIVEHDPAFGQKICR